MVSRSYTFAIFFLIPRIGATRSDAALLPQVSFTLIIGPWEPFGAMIVMTEKETASANIFTGTWASLRMGTCLVCVAVDAACRTELD